MNTNNGLQSHAHPAWLHLYLATCKLLHLALSLPATRLPQFQMYRWAFVGDDVFASDGDISNSSPNSDQLKATPNFIPYLTRIYRLLRNKVFEALARISPPSRAVVVHWRTQELRAKDLFWNEAAPMLLDSSYRDLKLSRISKIILVTRVL